jgi:protein gp37
MNKTAIGWTEFTLNPASGCAKVSAGCKYCYAEHLAEQRRGTKAFPNGFDLTLRPKMLDAARSKRAASLIFTSSMTDVFYEGIDDAYRHQIFSTIEATPRHRYQILTKRPEIALKWFRARPCPDHVWLGVTVEDARVARRLDVLRKIDARVKFVSAEPLIGSLDRVDLSGIDWLIAGGESGGHLKQPEVVEERGLVRRGGRGEKRWVPREDRYDWVRSLRDRCVGDKIAFWFKQWGGPIPTSAGRILDGRTWDELPTVPGALPDGYVHAERQTHGRIVLPIAAE